MTENKLFCKWLLFVTLMIFGIAKGIPTGLTLIPAPLPEVAFETEAAINAAWIGNGQERLLRELERTERAIWRDALKSAVETPP